MEKFSLHRAYHLMQCSAIAYGTVEEARGQFLMAQKVSMIEDERTDTQIMTYEWDDMAVAAIRGTSVSENTSGVDIVRNGKVFFKRGWEDRHGNQSRVHRGYGNAVEAIYGPLLYWVDKMRAQGRRVDGTGHSMGGVEISGAASLIKFDSVYTFGAPRFGDQAFAASVEDEAIYRVVLGGDIASSYPHPLLGYYHAGERHQLSYEGQYTRPRGLWQDYFHYPYIEGKTAHEPLSYIKATRLALQRGDHEL